jgi:4-amino-4-deoxy-L-arabinose transferase-like glycosyltransferase
MPRPVLLAVWLTGLAAVGAALHVPWISAAWVAALVSAALWFRPPESSHTEIPHTFPGTSLVPFLLILVTATLLRVYRFDEFPLGPYIDELVIVVRTLQVSEGPFDLFGHTPLMRQGWVETPNLYLYFNALLLKLFGIDYLGLKLLSIVPGVAACVGFYLICIRVFSERVALCTTMLFAAGHWPVRLSRYGWDVSFMVMAFAATLALLIRGVQQQRASLAYLAGVVAGISLYSYAASRLVVLSVAIYLAMECLARRDRGIANVAVGFCVGVITAAFPLLCYYASNTDAFWVRAAELSVFNSSAPWLGIIDNVWRHALMFHVHGGYYARDNIPGMAMMDPVTGFLLLAGLAVVLAQRQGEISRLVPGALAINLLPGILTTSQEGAPYVYRVAATMIPAFLAVGVGLQAAERRYELLRKAEHPTLRLKAFAIVLFLAALSVNLFQYFGFEAANSAAMRTMAYEQRLISREIASDDANVLVVGEISQEKIEITSLPEERYPERNPPMRLPPPVGVIATIILSGRYDSDRTLQQNVDAPRGLSFMVAGAPLADALKHGGATKIIFDARDNGIVAQLRSLSSNFTLRHINNIHGNPIIAVATIGDITAR